MITVKCSCGEIYHTEKQNVGRKLRCKCGKILEIIAPPHFQDTSPIKESEKVANQHCQSKPKIESNWKHRAIIASICALLVFLIGPTIWMDFFPDKELSTNYSTSGSTIPAPAGKFQQSSPSCPLENIVRPQSSYEIGGRNRDGLGKLQIDNGTQYDAIASLVNEVSNVSVRAIFIRSQQNGYMTSIPKGQYHVQFQIGSDYLKYEGRFCRTKCSYEFENKFDYSETKSDRGITYSSYSVTLHPVLEGTARTKTIPDGLFKLPPISPVEGAISRRE
jgi:hypothetical protein